MSAGSNEREGASHSGVAPEALDRMVVEGLLPTLIEAALAAVVTMDQNGVVRAWNRRAQTTFGWSAREAVGRRLVELVVPPSYRQAHNAGLAHFRDTGEGPVLGQVLELSALHRDGHEFPVELRISEAARVDGATLFIAFILDISERKTREGELLAAYEEARSSRQAIDEFVSMVVHELRQPLSVVTGYADLLLQTMTPEDEPRYGAPLNAILRKSVEASKLISDILTAAKLEAGGLAARIGVFDMSDRVRSAAGRAVPAATLRGGSVSVVGDGEAVHALGDPDFVDTILDNLISNAINYSAEQPAIHLRLSQGTEVEIVVADSGKGIAPEMHERIFERFVRVQDRTHEPGTGLGLYVSRHLAHRQNGSLELVSSHPGAGSTFALRLPSAPPVAVEGG